MNIRAIEQNAFVMLGGKIRLEKHHRQNLVNNLSLYADIVGKSLRKIIGEAGDSSMRYYTYQRFENLYYSNLYSYHLKSTIDRLAQLMGQPTDKALTRLSREELKNSILSKGTITFDLNKYSVQILNNNLVLKEKSQYAS